MNAPTFTFFKIYKHVHPGGDQPATTWYHSASTREEATALVRSYNERAELTNNNPGSIPVTYSIGC